MNKKKPQKNHGQNTHKKNDKKSDTIQMSYAPRLDKDYHWFQHVPIIFFIGVIFMIVRMKTYTSPIPDVYWMVPRESYSDFFSYYKAAAIILTASISTLILLYRITTQSLLIKKTKLYIPMIIFVFFVILSWIFSDYPHFAYKGWNDRFEGSVVLISYFIMMFYIINTVNTEKTVKRIFTALGLTSFIAGLLGLTQYLGFDFFQTSFGKKMITPQSYWPHVDSLRFTFKNGEIYQTVYNINYVSFYLALLIPIFAMLFIRAKEMKHKIPLGVLTGLLIFNAIGSKSAGGLLGLGIAGLIGIIILNKRLIEWWKSVAVLLGMTILIVALTANTLFPELKSTIDRATAPAQEPSIEKIYIDYFDTENSSLFASLNGKELEFRFNMSSNMPSMTLYDMEGSSMGAELVDKTQYIVTKEGYENYSFRIFAQEDSYYLQLIINDANWNFTFDDEKILFRNIFGKLVDLNKIETFGFEGREDFGSGRGYIWSRSLPVMKTHFFIGSGADTYIFEFPHKDYTGKANSTGYKQNVIVDKPHSMYIQTGVNTGLISLFTLLALFLIYIIQSIKLYWKNTFETFSDYIGVGIFLGVCGFLVGGLTNDTTVSVMPIFYGIFAIGIAVNLFLLQRKTN